MTHLFTFPLSQYFQFMYFWLFIVNFYLSYLIFLEMLQPFMFEIKFLIFQT